MTAYSNAVKATPGLLNYWRMGQGFGDCPDANGGPELALLGTVVHDEPGPLAFSDGGAVSFNGTDGCGVAELDLSAETTITVEFFLKWDEYVANDDLAMEFSANFNGVTGGFLIDPNNGGGKWGLGIGDAGERRNNAFFANPSAGVWHHYAFVFDTTAEPAKQIIPYVDGVPIEFTKELSGTGQGNFLKTVLNVMSRNSESLFGGGDMCHLAIYSGALSAKTVEEHYAAKTKEGTPDKEEGEEEEGGGGGEEGSSGPEARPPFAVRSHSYDAIVGSATAIRAAANNPGNAGKVIAIKGGSYPTLDFRGSGGHPPVMFGPAAKPVTFIPLPGQEVKIKGVEMRWTRNITFEGIKWSEGGIEIVSADDFSNPAPFDPGEAYHNQNITLYGCEWLGGNINCCYAQAWTDNLTFEGCYFHDTNCPEGKDIGYGIQFSGGNGLNRNIKIRRCWFDNFANDMVQLSSTEGVIIDRCEFGKQERQNPSSHLDVCQLFGVKNVEITNNYSHDGGIEQGFFFEYGWSGKCVIKNNLMLDSTTKKLWWTGNVIASGTILVESNTVWNSNGCYIQAAGTKAFTVLNNIFDQFDVEKPEVIDKAENNQIGGKPEYDINHQCLNFPQGYRAPTEVWWVIPPPTPSRVAVAREYPPDQLAVRIDAPNGYSNRWAEDEFLGQNVMSGIELEDEMPGGDKSMNGVLARDPQFNWYDMEAYAEMRVYNPLMDVFEGFLDKAPDVSGDQMSITPQALGYQSILEDDRAASMGFIDSDMTKWGDISTQRRIEVLSVNYQWNVDMATGFQDAGETPPGLVFTFTTKVAGQNCIGEAWYYGDGADIGMVITDFRSLTGVGEDGRFVDQVGLANQDSGAGPYNVGANLKQVTTNEHKVSASELGRKYAWITNQFNEPGGVFDFTNNVHGWLTPKVIGTHGMEPQGTWPSIGYRAKQMLEYLIPRLAAPLECRAEDIDDDGFLIQQAWYGEKGPTSDIVHDLTKYSLYDWFVRRGKRFQLKIPGSYGKFWKAYVAGSNLNEVGLDSQSLWKEIVVRYQDVTGRTCFVGPPGSNCEVESPLLELTDPDHPAVRAKRTRREVLDLRGISNPGQAIEVGIRFLEEANLLNHAGSATLTGYVMDHNSIFWPAACVKSGDWVSFVDAADSSYRKIVNRKYNHAQKGAEIDIDAPPSGMEALLERLQASLGSEGVTA